MIGRREHHGGRRRRSERGAVFVEFALAVPFLVVMGLGIVEYGMAWSAANDVNAAARDAARAGTSAPAYLTADQTILQTIGTSLNSKELAGLKRVIVYKAANATDTSPPAACLNVGPNTTGSSSSAGSAKGVASSSGYCNVYGPGQIQYVLNPSSVQSPWWVNSAGTSCDTSRGVDRYWCPATRNHTSTGDNLDYLGVYIEMQHDSLVGAGFGNEVINRTAVFRLEPDMNA